MNLLAALGLPLLMLLAAWKVFARKRRGEETGNLGFRPVSPGGNPVFAPIHFGGGEVKQEYVDEAYGAAPPIPGQRGPSPTDLT